MDDVGKTLINCFNLYSFIDLHHFIQIYLPGVLPSLILTSFQVLSLALVKLTLMMFVNIAMTKVYVKNFAINKNRLVEAISEKKMFQFL